MSHSALRGGGKHYGVGSRALQDGCRFALIYTQHHKPATYNTAVNHKQILYNSPPARFGLAKPQSRSFLGDILGLRRQKNVQTNNKFNLLSGKSSKPIHLAVFRTVIFFQSLRFLTGPGVA